MSPASAIEVGSSYCTGGAIVASPCGAAVNRPIPVNLAIVKPLQHRANWYALATSPEPAPETKDQGNNNSPLALQPWKWSHAISVLSGTDPSHFRKRYLLVRRFLAKMEEVVYLPVRHYYIIQYWHRRIFILLVINWVFKLFQLHLWFILMSLIVMEFSSNSKYLTPNMFLKPLWLYLH